MAYSDFTTLTKVREAFGLTIEESINLFTDTPEIFPSSYLQTTLNENVFLATAINTEKARAELIIAPVLLEVRRILNFQNRLSRTDQNAIAKPQRILYTASPPMDETPKQFCLWEFPQQPVRSSRHLLYHLAAPN